MIANRDRTVVLSSLGWVEGDAIWSLDVASGQARTIPQNTGARSTSRRSPACSTPRIPMLRAAK
jgi:hypothetical protein